MIYINSRKNISIITLICLIVAFCFLEKTEVEAQIKLIYPQNEDTLFVTEDINFKWENEAGNLVSLFYSDDNGTNWKLIADKIISDTFTWQVPYLSHKNILFKIEENISSDLKKLWHNDIAHSQEIRNCEFSENGKHLLTSGTDGYFRIWDIEQQKIHTEFRHYTNELMYSAQFWNGIDTVIYSIGNKVWMWNRTTNSAEYLFPINDHAFFVATNERTRKIAVCSHLDGDTKGNTVVLYSMDDRKELKRFNNPELPEDDYYRCTFSPSGKYLAFVGYYKVLNVYDVENDKLKSTVSEPGTNVFWGVDFSFDEQEVIVSGLDGTIRRYALPDLLKIKEYNFASELHMRSIKYTNDKNDVLFGGLSQNFYYGDLDNNQLTSVNVGYQITDVSSFDNKYYLITGRKVYKEGKFTLFEVAKNEPTSDTIKTNIFYKVTAQISDVKAKYGNKVIFPLNFYHTYNNENIPFNKINIAGEIVFPSKVLDFQSNAPKQILNDSEYVYDFNVKYILTEDLFEEFNARVILGNVISVPIYFKNCYSDNEMVLIDTISGKLEIENECIEAINRNISSAKGLSLEIENDIQNKDLIIIANVPTDDKYFLNIYDINGNVYEQQQILQAKSFSLNIQKERFPQGSYFVRLSSEYHSVMKKFVIVK
ncbi:MAG: T9SS type A sorting domain-containing protein [Ignavibacteria bacterium]|jgi:WD40 repeat protein|nr:T9SS type A sorting domain-containing protein [Ignavibacteria bacterium]